MLQRSIFLRLLQNLLELCGDVSLPLHLWNMRFPLWLAFLDRTLHALAQDLRRPFTAEDFVTTIDELVQ